MDRTRKSDLTAESLRGLDLRGKTLGVIGIGNIGRCVIAIARGFGMNVLASDLKPDREFAAQLGFDYPDMQDLLAQADIVTRHVPAIDAPRHLLSTNEFATMKDGAVLINTARGLVVDMQALLHALTDGKLSAAGADVLSQELVIREQAKLLRGLQRAARSAQPSL